MKGGCAIEKFKVPTKPAASVELSLTAVKTFVPLLLAAPGAFVPFLPLVPFGPLPPAQVAVEFPAVALAENLFFKRN